MPRKPKRSDDPAEVRRRAKPTARRHAGGKKSNPDVEEETHHPMMAGLRRRAEATLREQQKQKRSQNGGPSSKSDPQRLLHELEVHQIELELQNAELQRARDELEQSLEQYTDLYDFAPAGYFSVDESGVILQVNLAGAALLGVERSLLTDRRLTGCVAPASRPDLLAFLKRVFAGTGKQACEVEFLKPGAAPFWASIHGVAAIVMEGATKWCRLAVSDLTPLKEAQEVKLRLEGISVANRELKQEIVRRQAVEEALRESEQQQKTLLEQSQRMHEQLRNLSRQILQAQEEERKRISRELHDEIAQSLAGINVYLEALKLKATTSTKGIGRNIANTQKLVEKSVDKVHRFARELRPTMLDDLGLIPALHTYAKDFALKSHVQIHIEAFAGVEALDISKRTALFRVVQESLTNISRHAKASVVTVSLKKYADGIRLEICDDGKSFPVEKTLRTKGNKRLGLIGMRERIEMVGGSFSIESTPGKGTTVHAQIPFDKTSSTGGGRKVNLLNRPK